MPSVSNCNTPNKSRRIASRQKIQRKRAAAGIRKNPRGTNSSVQIFPTSGPLAPLSGKKARKVEKARKHALAREAERQLREEEEARERDAALELEKQQKKAKRQGGDVEMS
jgi:hypothetical protein